MIKKVFYIKKFFFSLHIKMNNTTYYQRNRNVALNKEKQYYKNNNERLKKQARDKYWKLSEEHKVKKQNMEKIDIICLKKICKN